MSTSNVLFVIHVNSHYMTKMGHMSSVRFHLYRNSWYLWNEHNIDVLLTYHKYFLFDQKLQDQMSAASPNTPSATPAPSTSSPPTGPAKSSASSLSKDEKIKRYNNTLPLSHYRRLESTQNNGWKSPLSVEMVKILLQDHQWLDSPDR